MDHAGAETDVQSINKTHLLLKWQEQGVTLPCDWQSVKRVYLNTNDFPKYRCPMGTWMKAVWSDTQAETGGQEIEKVPIERRRGSETETETGGADVTLWFNLL